METELKENERIDDLQIHGFRLIQDPSTFCFGMDAVLLSDFAKVQKKERVLDMGCGNGVIPILLAAKSTSDKIVGLEIQEQMAQMARRSVHMNALDDRVEIVCGDIKEAASVFGAASFDAITTNPPYMIADHGLQNPQQAKNIARHEVLCDLEDVISQAAKLLKPGGRFYMVHRPFRLTEILTLMHACKLEPKRLRMVHSFVDAEPSMVLVEGKRGAKSGMVIGKPLIIYESEGVYSREIDAIYGREEAR